jgi:aspartyl-tRNA(Asn)/glutamyl-tRNA(Gln) amidotransferase subunit A
MQFKSITQVKQALKKKEVSVEEVFDIFHGRAKENKYNEFITVIDKPHSLIKNSQKRIDTGEDLPLEGIPVAVKDLFLTKGIKTTSASRALENFVPTFESDATEKLVLNGAIMVGKTNMDEFAMGSTTSTGYFGKCLNPHVDPSTGELGLSPGGSSGGSAVSVASGSSLLSLGTDTGGSVRQPAALCGVVGMKPSYGTCSRYGMIAYASSLDQTGVFANNVEDVALGLDVVSGFDPRDPCMAQDKLRGFSSFGSKIGDSIKGMRVAFIQDSLIDQVEPDIKQALSLSASAIEKLGGIVDTNIEIKHLEKAIVVYYAVSTAECFSNLACFDGIRYGTSVDIESCRNIDDLYTQNRNHIFGTEVMRRISIGAFVLSKENYEGLFIKSAKVRRLIQQSFSELFHKYDAVIMPTTPEVADPISTPKSVISVYLNDLFTVGASCAGLPAISIPFYKNANGLPIGIQIVGNHFQDHKVIQIAHQLLASAQ